MRKRSVNRARTKQSNRLPQSRDINASANDLSERTAFIIIEDRRVAYEAATLLEALAFLAGRGRGVLCGVLSFPGNQPPRTS